MTTTEQRQTYPPKMSTLTIAPSEEWEGFERQLEFQTAYDGRDVPENYGIHGCELKLILKGEEGASTLLIFTGWHLPHVTAEWGERPPSSFLTRPNGVDIGYHAAERPAWLDEEGDEMHFRDDCAYTKTGKCWYDGSALRAEGFVDLLIAQGMDAVWEALRKEYVATFRESE